MKIFKSTAVSACLAIVGLGSSATTLANNNFSGPYIGVESSYIQGKDKATISSSGIPFVSQNLKPDGMGVGILGGYNWALGSKAILGIEAGYNYYREADDYKDLLNCSGAECQFKSDVKQSVSAVGRLGYLITNNTLVYGLFGYSGAQIKRSLNVIIEGTDSETNKKWQNGWVAGAGVEYLASKNVSVKLEYRYSDLGNSAYNLSGFPSVREKFDYTQDQVLLGVNYRF